MVPKGPLERVVLKLITLDRSILLSPLKKTFKLLIFIHLNALIKTCINKLTDLHAVSLKINEKVWLVS